MIHLDAYFIEHVDNRLIVCVSVLLFLFDHICDFNERLRIVLDLIERLQRVQPVLDLCLDLLPLQLIVLKYGLYLFDDLLLVDIEFLLLHPERPLDILKQVLRRLYLLIRLLLPLRYDRLDVLLLEVNLVLHLRHHLVDVVN